MVIKLQLFQFDSHVVAILPKAVNMIVTYFEAWYI